MGGLVCNPLPDEACGKAETPQGVAGAKQPVIQTMTNLTAATQTLTAAKLNATKSAIMTAAWSIFKGQTGSFRMDFATCLRRAWAEAKSNLAKAQQAVTTMTATKNGRKYASQSFNVAASSQSALFFYANRNLPEYRGLNHSDAITTLERIAAKSGFAAQVAATCLNTGRISEKQLAILVKAA